MTVSIITLLRDLLKVVFFFPLAPSIILQGELFMNLDHRLQEIGAHGPLSSQ